MNNYVVNAAGLNNEEHVKPASININSNKSSNVNRYDKLSAFGGVVVSGHDRDINKDNTYKSLIDQADDVKKQIQASAQCAKDNLKALFNRLSGADAVKIDEDGFNLNDATNEDMINIVDRIKIELAAHGERVYSAGAGPSQSTIENAVGSAGLANAISKKIKEAGLPDTQDNVNEINDALDKFMKVKDLSHSEKAYLISNGKEPTISNIYMASHLSDTQAVAYVKPLNTSEWNQLRPQVSQLFNEAGIAISDEKLEDSKQLIEQGVLLTKDNLIYKDQLDNLSLGQNLSEKDIEDLIYKLSNAMANGQRAQDVNLINSDDIYTKVSDSIDTLNKANVLHINELYNEGRTLSIENLKLVTNNSFNTYEVNYEAISHNYEILQQARCLLTAQAGCFLARNNINFEVMPLSEVVKELEAFDKTQSFYIDNSLSENEYKSYSDFNRAVFEINNAPDTVIGLFLKESNNKNINLDNTMSISNVSCASAELRIKYESAGQLYNAVGTQIRKDLGDSLNKALSNSTSSILKELSLEESKDNADAVRILSSNNIDITKESILEVKEKYSNLKQLINKLKPQKVLDMIRERINPIDTDIAELCEYLDDSSENDEKEQSDKYSKFLYKLDNTNGITKSEREQFIDIYRMIALFNKDAGKAVGALVEQEKELTMGNLCTAYYSDKAAGMDIKLSNEVNSVKVKATVNYYSSLFANTANKLTPVTLKNVNDKQPIMQSQIDDFCETVNNEYNIQQEIAYNDKYINELINSLSTNDYVVARLENLDEKVSVSTVRAMQSIIEAGYFGKYYKTIDNKNKLADKDDIISKYVDVLDDETKLKKLYDNESDEVHKTLRESLLNNQTDYYSLDKIRSRCEEIGLIKKMADKNEYTVPYMTKDGIATLNLKLVFDEDSINKGKINITMSRESEYLSLEAKVNDNSIHMFCSCERDNQPELKNKIDTLSDKLINQLGYENVVTDWSTTKKVKSEILSNDEANSKVSSAKLYKISKLIVSSLI